MRIVITSTLVTQTGLKILLLYLRVSPMYQRDSSESIIHHLNFKFLSVRVWPQVRSKTYGATKDIEPSCLVHHSSGVSTPSRDSKSHGSFLKSLVHPRFNQVLYLFVSCLMVHFFALPVFVPSPCESLKYYERWRTRVTIDKVCSRVNWEGVGILTRFPFKSQKHKE